MIEKFKSLNQEIPVVVSKNRLKASTLCLQETAYVNLRDIYEAESFDIDSIDNGGININNSHYDDDEFSSHCAYGDVHDKYEKYKRISIIDDGFTALNIKKNLNKNKLLIQLIMFNIKF